MIAFTAPTPSLTAAFDLHLQRAAPIVVGRIGTGGVRSHVTVIGGRLEGRPEGGEIIGGSETRLKRADGVTLVEAAYLIRLACGATVRGHGTGYEEAGGALRLSLLFETPQEGAVPDAFGRAYVGEQATDSRVMTLHRID